MNSKPLQSGPLGLAANAQIRILCDLVEEKNTLNLKLDRHGFNSCLDHLLAALAQVFESLSFISFTFKMGIIMSHQGNGQNQNQIEKEITFNVLYKLYSSIKM